jgi:Flp pilus assembly protein TadG
MEMNLNKRMWQGGQSLVEFALVLPLLLLLVVNAVNFGTYLYALITIANAARAGAEYSLIGGAMSGAPSSPSAAMVTTLVTQDAVSLPNRASLQVRVCTNNNGTVVCAGPGTDTPAADPEAPLYVLTTVDVRYTYQPLIPLWSFPQLGIRATLPATAIHRRAVMRRMQ